MKAILIPKDRVKEFTKMLGKHNGIQPVELKDGTFFINDDYLKNESMVSDCKTEIDKMRLSVDMFITKTLTIVDYKISNIEIESIKIK